MLVYEQIGTFNHSAYNLYFILQRFERYALKKESKSETG